MMNKNPTIYLEPITLFSPEEVIQINQQSNNRYMIRNEDEEEEGQECIELPS
jgi:hypothetical protein